MLLGEGQHSWPVPALPQFLNGMLSTSCPTCPRRGTGDIAFRVLRAIRQAELEGRARPASVSRPTSAGGSSSEALGSVVVCDINPKMLEVGRSKAQQSSDLSRGSQLIHPSFPHRSFTYILPTPPKIGDLGLSFVEGNAETLPAFGDASFDSYTIAFGIRNVTDRDTALREAYRVLKPGGRYAHIICHCGKAQWGVQKSPSLSFQYVLR